MKRAVLARIPIGNNELVVSIDERDRIDLRLWTCTAGVSMASANGVTLPPRRCSETDRRAARREKGRPSHRRTVL
jgi:hypothetical protein